MNLNINFKSGFASIIGPPNAGKSTLLNTLLKLPLNIVSHKPQTTRNCTLGIWNNKEFQTQIIFTDTPGILKKEKSLLDKHMDSHIHKAIKEADFVLFLIDATDTLDNYKEVLEKIQEKKPLIVLFNKMDLLKNPDEWKKSIDCPYPFLLMEGQSPDCEKELIPLLLPHLKDNIEYYPTDMLSNRTQRFFVKEYVREGLLKFVENEIPHDCFVDITKMDELSAQYKIEGIIYCLKESQKKILIGKGGSMIKQIGIHARERCEEMLDKRVHLKLDIKVEKKWKDNSTFLSRLEYY